MQIIRPLAAPPNVVRRLRHLPRPPTATLKPCMR
jgi:hypothetical protein